MIALVQFYWCKLWSARHDNSNIFGFLILFWFLISIFFCPVMCLIMDFEMCKQDDLLYAQYGRLNCELMPVEVDSEEFSMVQHLYHTFSSSKLWFVWHASCGQWEIMILQYAMLLCISSWKRLPTMLSSTELYSSLHDWCFWRALKHLGCKTSDVNVHFHTSESCWYYV